MYGDVRDKFPQYTSAAVLSHGKVLPGDGGIHRHEGVDLSVTRKLGAPEGAREGALLRLSELFGEILATLDESRQATSGDPNLDAAAKAATSG